MSLREHGDAILGSAMTALGSGGATYQLLSNVANLTVVILNIILALGGLYLLYLRIRKARRENRE